MINATMSETLTKSMLGFSNMLKKYVDDEIKRSEQDIKGDYILQMNENPKLKKYIKARRKK